MYYSTGPTCVDYNYDCPSRGQTQFDIHVRQSKISSFQPHSSWETNSQSLIAFTFTVVYQDFTRHI